MRSAAVALLLMTASATAFADPTKVECVEADTRAQNLRSAGKLHDARVQLEICIADACPAIVRQDCTERLDDVMRVSPSLIFLLQDALGSDVTGASVMMDGRPFLTSLDGKAVAVDPGQHTFTFAAPGHATKDEVVLIHEGDRDRRISVVIASTPTPESHDARVDVKSDVAPHRSLTPWKATAIATMSVGAAALGVGAAFGFVAMSKQSDANCPSNVCQDASHLQTLQSAGMAGDVSTILFVAGGLLGATGLVLFIVAPNSARVAVGVGPSGISLGGVW